MATNFRDKLDKLPKKRREKIEANAQEKVKDVQLAELRKILDLTQKELANRLDKSQAAISKMEKQKDMNITTLRSCIEAMGLELEVSVKVPKKVGIKSTSKRKYRLQSFSSKECPA